MPNNNNDNNDTEPGEFGVEWAPTVDESALFDADDHKLDVVANMSGVGVVDDAATHGMTDDASSSRSGGSVDDQEPATPAPYTPSPTKMTNSGAVEHLDSGTSRLASFSSGLQLRFSEKSKVSRMSITDNSILTDYNGADDSHNNIETSPALLFPGEEKEEAESHAFQATAWPGDDDADEDEDADEEAHKEEEGGDAFSVGNKQPKALQGDEEEKPSRKSKLSKELSTTWMKFDDDKWEGSKNEDSKGASPPEQAPPSSSNNEEKKKSGGKTFSLEAGLAKVSDKSKSKSKGPDAEGKGGADANEVISFWGEGSEETEEQSANDPLAIALKSKPAAISECNNESFRSALMSSKSSTLDGPQTISSRSSSLGGPQQLQQPQHPQQPGWIQKGLGQAIGIVTSNLPFTKSNDDDDDDDNDMEEDNVEEVDDMPFPNYTKNASHRAPATRLGADKYHGPMQDISAMSDDSAFEDQQIRRSEATLLADNNTKNGARDPTSSAVVDKMNDQRITFAEEVKEEKKIDLYSMPIYDMFVDLPHPAESEKSASEVFIGAATEEADDIEIQNDIRNSLADISCLAFPDYDSSTAQEASEDGAVSLEVRRYMKHPLETPGFQHYTFPLKLQSGSLVYAHVRRYLPALKDVPFRYDVGRRLGRALVIFSRYPGGDDFFASLLRTLDGVSSQHAAMRSTHITRPQKWFLQNLSKKHHRLCGHYATNTEDRRGSPHIITLQGLEFADSMEYYATVDATHFFVPNNLLHAPLVPDMKTSYNGSILPVMRCLGVVNTMRLLSAMMSECRVVVVSVSPTRLDRSIRGAMAILTQGMLNWPHLSIPVLPPDLWSCLSSPTPYIVGVLSPMAYRLELIDDLGDVVVFNLDENTVTGMGSTKLPKLVPDVCRGLSEAMIGKRRIPLPENVATEQNMANLSILNSTSDILAQDLVEILKADKQTMNGTAVAAKHMAKKASKAVKSTLQYFWGGGDKEDGEAEGTETKKSKRERRMEPDYIFIEGCRNEAGEEAVRLAFVSFFLRVLGNAEGYANEAEGPTYTVNKDQFLKERKERGDGEGTPMGGIILNFIQSKMLQEYVQVREEHIRKRQPAPIDAPLFWKCIDFLELKNIDFGVINVRSVARMMLQKSSVQQMLPSNVRRLTMALTSKRKFEGNVDEAISDLAELSRESASSIYDVMSVIWLRTRDCKGLQWVHGYQAMKVLREVLLHGPLSAVAHAADGIQTIRKLAFRNSQGCEQIQGITLDIYNLLSDRSRLVLRRRVAGEARRKYFDPEAKPLTRDTRFSLESPFKDLHAAMHPSLRPPEARQRRASLSSRRASLSSRLPHRLSITKHILALEPTDESLSSFPNVLPIEKRASRHSEFLHDTFHRPEQSISGSMTGDIASARRYVREVARKTAEEEKNRSRESSDRRDANAMGVELLKKQFMLLKVAIYICPIFYFFGNHEHFLTIVMFVWLSQQLQVFKAPIDKGSY